MVKKIAPPSAPSLKKSSPRQKKSRLSVRQRKKNSHSSRLDEEQLAAALLALPPKLNFFQQLLVTFNRHKILLLLLAAASLLRFTYLANLPWGLNRDEAALAYNAYLLAQTGKDEWQRVYPVVLESFGDFKLPGYTYILVALSHFFSLSDFLVRFPSALAGVILVGCAYALVFLCTDKKYLALLAAAMVTFNPVFIWYARGAWEANLSLGFLALAAVIMIQRYQQRCWRPASLMAAFVFLLLSFFSYNASLLIMASLWLFLPWLSGGWYKWRYWLPLMGISGVALITAGMLLWPASQQKTGITLFTDATVQQEYTQYRAHLSPIGQRLWGSKIVYLSTLMAARLCQQFSPTFWLHSGSHEWHQLPNTGIWNMFTCVCIYLSLLFMLVAFIYDIWQARRWYNVVAHPYLKIFFLIVVATLPSIITLDAPHVTRSLVFIFILTLVGAYIGNFVALRVQYYQPLLGSLVRFRQWLLQSCLVWLMILYLGFTGAVYWQNYRHTLSERNLYQGGLSQLLSVDDSPTVIVNNMYGNQPYQYIQLAWETKMSPERFWQTLIRAGANPHGIKGVSDLGQYHFLGEHADPWSNWQVIFFNQQTQRWEKRQS